MSEPKSQHFQQPSFKDHFSDGSGLYARYRPRYPRELFDFLADQAPACNAVWDCACGSGQATEALKERFEQVLGTDASVPQLAGGGRDTGAYASALAEAPPLANASVDLVTVAQAFHWLDFEAFHDQVRRVLRPGGLLAVWCYTTLSFGDQALDRHLTHFYQDTVGPFWPPERRYLEAGYRGLPFPYRSLAAPAFAMTAHWTLAQLLGYLRTWSASRRFTAARSYDPVTPLEPHLAEIWGAEPVRQVVWPLVMRAGYHP